MTPSRRESGASLATRDAVIDALADAVAERLASRPDRTALAVVDAATVARRIGMSSEWVRAHYRELGGWKLGRGKRPRYRFDLAEAERAVRERGAEPPETESAPTQRTSRRVRKPRSHERLLPIRGTDPT